MVVFHLALLILCVLVGSAICGSALYLRDRTKAYLTKRNWSWCARYAIVDVPATVCLIVVIGNVTFFAYISILMITTHASLFFYPIADQDFGNALAAANRKQWEPPEHISLLDAELRHSAYDATPQFPGDSLPPPGLQYISLTGPSFEAPSEALRDWVFSYLCAEQVNVVNGRLTFTRAWCPKCVTDDKPVWKNMTCPY